MATEPRDWPNVAIPPGEFLAETLESLGLTQAQLARRSGRPTQAINEIVRGAKEITPETALQLERVLGVPAHIWTRMESDYRYVKARLEDQERLKTELPLAKSYPYAAMARLQWVAETRDPLTRVRELLSFFGVSSLRHLQDAHVAAFRKSEKVRVSNEALCAWLRQGHREAQHVKTVPFKAVVLRAALPKLRHLTTLKPEDFYPRLVELLASCGVALVVVPHLPRTGAQGATRWLTSEKALVQMSLRYGWDDIFWFSLFHELGHVLLHGRHAIFIEDHRKGTQEDEANKFACDMLIPPRAYAAFVRSMDLSAGTIRRFAAEQGIAASVVVGRLQHEKRVHPARLNDLRTLFDLAS